MTKKELLEKLQEYPDDTQVVFRASQEDFNNGFNHFEVENVDMQNVDWKEYPDGDVIDSWECIILKSISNN